MSDNSVSTVRANISKYIVKYLSENKCSKAGFGKLLGVTATSVNRWIEGICAPDIELLPKLSEILNVSIPELLGDEASTELKPDEKKVLKLYGSNIEFKELVNRYMNDENFKKSIDYIANIKG